MTRLVWPISARQKFKDGLCVLWLRMGLVWQRDPLNMLFGGAPTHAYMDLREEFDFQVFLARLEKIRESANHEFALRGPFADATAGRMLKGTQAMLDAFHAMNVMISQNPRASKGEAEILKYTATERAELCARISHLFQGRPETSLRIVEIVADQQQSACIVYESRDAHAWTLAERGSH